MAGIRWTGKIAMAVLILAAAAWATVDHAIALPPPQLWALVIGYLALVEGLWLVADKQAVERENRYLRRGLQRLPRRPATPRSKNDWCLTGGRSRLADVQAGVDAPREYYTGLLSSLTNTQSLPRLHLLAGPVGSGRSTLLLRLGQALADRGEIVLRALPVLSAEATEVIIHDASQGRPAYLLLDDLDSQPQAQVLLYELLRSGKPLIIIATMLSWEAEGNDRDSLEALAPANYLSLATVHDIQLTPNDLGALINKLGALSLLERTEVSGDGTRSYLGALEHLLGEALTSRFWERGEALSLAEPARLMVALAAAAEVAFPPALFAAVVAPDNPTQWEKAGLVMAECGQIMPPHQATGLALLARGGYGGPAVGEALRRLLQLTGKHAPALAPRLLCGLAHVAPLRALAEEEAEVCRARLTPADLSPALRYQWQETWEALGLPPDDHRPEDSYPPARAAEASDLLRRGQYAAALDVYQQLLSDPTYGDLARFNCALVLAHLESYDEAEEQLDRLSRPLPGVDYLRGVIAEKRGDLVAALDFYEKSRKADEVTLPATRRLAFTYLRSGAPRAAIPLLESMLSFTPLRADLYGALAVAHLHAGVTQRAAAQSARAIQAGVEPSVARKAVARAFRDTNAFDRMRGELEVAVNYAPEDLEAWDDLAQACHWLGRFEREEQCLNQLRRAPRQDEDQVLLRLARCYRNQGRAAEAMDLLRPLTEATEAVIQALLLAAEVAAMCGQRDQQRALAEAALRRGDSSGWAHFWWADSQEGEASEIADSYRRAIRLFEARLQGGVTPRQAATLWQAVHLAATRLADEALAERALKQARQEALVCKAIGSEIESVTARRSVPADVFVEDLSGPPASGTPSTDPGVAPRPAAGGLPVPIRPAPLPNRYQQRS